MDVDKDTFRGRLFYKFIRKYIKNPSESIVLDVGCSYGALTFELAKTFKKVIGIDVNEEALAINKENLKNIKNVVIQKMNILETDFNNNFFDLIIFEGVFEWVGLSNQKKSPKECQKQALREAKRILKKDGIIYIGIENRFFPYFWLVDPHAQTSLTVILPRFLSKFIYQRIKNKYYGLRIYSYWGYAKLLREQFISYQIMVPIPNYKYLYEISRFDRREIKNKVRKVKKIPNLRKTYKYKLLGIKIISSLFLTKLLVPSFVILSKKKNN